MTRRILIPVTAVVAALALSACGTENVETSDIEPQYQAGADLFVENCSGCHTLSSVGAEGSAIKINNRERVDGPNFDQRAETKDQVLYAIRNGGFSGAIMPENIVTGPEAQELAAFLAKYAGADKPAAVSPTG
ncbi:MAG: cytochrome c [Solirubrobacteraceae bacterium]|nr:cytochrome c [Solirubrobacteraceae bacterium]